MVSKEADWTFAAARASLDNRPLVVATKKKARGTRRTSYGKKKNTDVVINREDYPYNLLQVRPIFSQWS